MPEIIRPGAGLLFMKVGMHAQESLADIVRRKRKEIDEAGHAYWGYGGSTCHPSRVQPFVQSFEERGDTIYLCMQPMVSNHVADPVRAEEFSVDGFKWEEIPAPINAKGSRFALIIDSLEEEHFDLPLSQTRVACGNSMGARGDRYIKGRVNKGCFEIVGAEHDEQPERVVEIGLVARIVSPYAVFLRNRPAV